MRFFQASTFYDAYLAQAYARHPEWSALPYAAQIEALLDDGFGAGHMVVREMEALGHEVFCAIPNCRPLQEAWLRERGLGWPQDPDPEAACLRLQCQAFAPDAWYTTDPIRFDSRFVRSLHSRPAWVGGWRNAAIPPGTDFSAFDALLASAPTFLDQARAHGAPRVHQAYPGFPRWLALKAGGVPKAFDVFFCGQWTPAHAHRNRLLAEGLARIAAARPQVRVGLFLSGIAPESLPEPLRGWNRGGLWGLDMYRQTRAAKVVLNASIDHTGDDAANMRLFEVTGMGSFLLTQAHGNLQRFFAPGEELQTFAHAEALAAQTLHALENEGERETVARQGQVRCFNDHTLEKRAQDLDAFIADALGQERLPSPGAPPASWSPVSSEKSRETPSAKEGPGADARKFPGVSFGDGVQVIGASQVRIGEGSCIGDQAWINVCVPPGSGPRLTVGRHVLVGRRSTLSTAGSLELGDFCLLAPDVYVSDADHRYGNLEVPILWNGVTEGRTLVVEENCWLGNHAVVSGGLTVGRGSVVGANAVLLKDLPPFSVAVGNPARIVKQYNPETRRWEKVEGEADLSRIRAARERCPLPNRSAYRETLHGFFRKSGAGSMEPIVAGRGEWRD